MFDRSKKSVSPEPSPVSSFTPEPPSAPPEVRPSPPPVATTRRRDAAVIGSSIQIEGHLRGQEDLIVEGEVNGTIHLENHTLTIGSQGKIKANVYAHTVNVDGAMEGDLYGAEQVTIRKSARVRGNITSPRVSLEDGASFKGSIEMDPEAVKKAVGSSGSRPQQVQASSTPAFGGEVAKGGIAR